MEERRPSRSRCFLPCLSTGMLNDGEVGPRANAKSLAFRAPPEPAAFHRAPSCSEMTESVQWVYI
jgi:hypothetical protein